MMLWGKTRSFKSPAVLYVLVVIVKINHFWPIYKGNNVKLLSLATIIFPFNLKHNFLVIFRFVNTKVVD